MRILFVTNNYTPYTGGVVSSINTATDALRAMGHEVFIITLDFMSSTQQDPAYVLRVPCFLKFKYRTNYMALPWLPRTHLKRLIQSLRPDIIHIHHPFLLGNYSADIARLCSIPVVFTYHTLYETYAHYVPMPPYITQFFIRRAMNRVCSLVNGIIVPSSGLREHVPAIGQQKPIAVIPSGINPLFIMPPVKSQRSKDDSFKLLIVSRLVPEKNITLLIDVFAKIASDGRFKLTIAGYGYLYDSLQQHAYDYHGLSKKQLMFVHYPTKDQLRNLYVQADLFLFASHTDTQGLVLAESMISGTPVLAFDGIGQRAIIKNGSNGFIVNTMEDMVDTIRRLVEDPELLILLRQEALQTSQRYTPSVMAERLLAFYQQIQTVY